MSQLSRENRFALPPSFCSTRTLNGLGNAHNVGEPSAFRSSPSQCSSHAQTPSQTEKVFHQLPGHP